MAGPRNSEGPLPLLQQRISANLLIIIHMKSDDRAIKVKAPVQKSKTALTWDWATVLPFLFKPQCHQILVWTTPNFPLTCQSLSMRPRASPSPGLRPAITSA